MFCDIARGRVPARVLYEDDRVVVFPDIRPAARQHLLVIPRQHVANTHVLQGQDDLELGEHLTSEYQTLMHMFTLHC